MKKYLFLISLLFYILFFTGLDVNALSLSAPTYYFTEINDASASSGTSSLVGWWGTNNYYYAYDNYLGNMAGDPLVNYRADYTFNNSNLCSNQDMMISGYVAGITGFFTNESYQLDIYNNNTKLACTTEVQENGSRLFYSCSGKGGGSYSISLKQQSFSGVQYQVGVSKDVDVVCNPSSQDIINSGIQNTDIIVNNNNQNTQTIIDKVDDTFTSCKPSKNLLYFTNITTGSNGITFTQNTDTITLNSSIDINGTSPWLYTFSTSNDVTLESGTYTFSLNSIGGSHVSGLIGLRGIDSSGNQVTFQQFGSDKSYTSRTYTSDEVSRIVKFQLYVSQGAVFDNFKIRPMFEKGSSATSYQPYGEVCTNKIDETNDLLKDTNNFLTSDEEPESDISALGNVQGLLPAGPVDSLLNIPFKFLSIIVSSLGDLCVPLSMNWVFNQSLTLPCFSDSFYNNVPSGLMVFINLIPTGFILIMYFKHLYKKVNRAVSMETTADDEWGVL